MRTEDVSPWMVDPPARDGRARRPERATGTTARSGAFVPGLLCLGLLGVALIVRGPWAPDEVRYLEVARELVEGAWRVVPHLNGGVYLEKPPLFFWIVGGLLGLGVGPAYAARLISAGAALFTVASLPRIGARLGLAPTAGARAALLLTTTPLFLVYAQAGTLDALLTAWMVAAVGAKLARAGASPRGRVLWTGLEGVLLGAALLTKGPVALLFPLGLRVGALAAGPAGPARPDRSDLAALAVGGGLAAGWLAATAAVAGADYARTLALGQVTRRLGSQAPHRHLPGFLLAVTAIGLLPWSALGLRAWWRARRRSGRSPGLRPLAGWLGLPALVLSSIPTQQAHYLLPGLPAAALLAAAPIGEERPGPPSLWLRGLASGLAGLLALPALVPDAVAAAVPVSWPPLDPLLHDPVLRGILAVGGAAVLGLVWRAPTGDLWTRTASAMMLLFAVGMGIAGRVDGFLMPRALRALPELHRARCVFVPRDLLASARLAGVQGLRASHKNEIVPELLARPASGCVGIVRDGAPGLPATLASGRLERVGSGWFRSRPVVAARVPPSDPATARPMREAPGRSAHEPRP